MQKSKKATIIIIITMLVYGFFATFKLIKEINILYLYIINPLFWLLLAGFLYLTLGKSIENKKMKKSIIQYTIVAILTYILIYMISGIVVTFGKNPYDTTVFGIITNIWMFGVAIVSKEYIRYKLIDNVYEKDKTTISILISIVYVTIDIDISRFIGNSVATYSCIRYIVQNILPEITTNVVFSYTARYGNWIPGALYKLCTNIYYWISPIIPNTPWVMTAIVDTTIPVILFLYIRYEKNKLDIFRTKENIINSDPRNVIPLVIAIILAIWFAIGIFPIKPVAIASGSMEKELYVGDIAIIKKCNANDVNVGDIIEYQMDGYTVIHRIIEKKQKNGEFLFITKGDNNQMADSENVKEKQLIGKVIFKIKYLGYPAIWLHLIQEEEAMVNVET